MTLGVAAVSDFADALAREVGRFAELLDDADPAAAVPTCGDWDVAELAVHVGMLHRWVDDLVDSRARVRTPKPEVDPGGDLARWLRGGGDALVARLREAPADPDLWTWAHDDGPVEDGLAFWARRMAHETLVHRLDLERALAANHAPVTPELAVDGIDELFQWFAEGVPDWMDFTGSSQFVTLATTDADRTWRLQLGRATGTTDSGRELDLPAMLLVDAVDGDDPATTAIVTAPAAALHRWLWGRDDVPATAVSGSLGVVARLRETIADAT